MFTVTTKEINLQDFHKVVVGNEKIRLSEEVIVRMQKNCDFFKEYTKDKVVYGYNTGFGPMAPYFIPDAQKVELQYNLIRSHATGSGARIVQEYVRAILFARLISIVQARSGISPQIAETLVAFLNAGIYPVVYEHGGVGASGDLIQLAHIALALLGEGDVYYQGMCISAKEALEKENIHPIEISSREGLALINGTSCMTGIGLLNVLHAKNLLEHEIMIEAYLHELVRSYDDSYSVLLNEVKPHIGQAEIAKKLRGITQWKFIT